eukprot:911856_1
MIALGNIEGTSCLCHDLFGCNVTAFTYPRVVVPFTSSFKTISDMLCAIIQFRFIITARNDRHISQKAYVSIHKIHSTTKKPNAFHSCDHATTRTSSFKTLKHLNSKKGSCVIRKN